MINPQVLSPQMLQVLAAEQSCPGHVQLMSALQALIDDAADQIARAATQEAETRAAADWRALRRVQALFISLTHAAQNEMTENPNYRPELENLRHQRDPRQIPGYSGVPTTGAPIYPPPGYPPPGYQQPQIPVPQYPVAHTTPAAPPMMPQPVPPYFRNPRPY